MLTVCIVFNISFLQYDIIIKIKLSKSKTYNYTYYDRILNLADLMASANGVITPEKRILDIEKRRKMTGNQRKFFIKELSETIYWYLKKINIPDELISLNDFESLSNLLYKSIYSKEDTLRLIKK